MLRINDKTFWINEWQSAADGSPFRGLFADERRLWDTSARSYDAGMGKNNLRVQKVLEALDNLGFWDGSPKRILDIGSGTGSLAIPLAKCGASVDALDSSAEMNRVLLEKCAAEGIGNIRVIAEDFNACQLSPASYDLVLGSLNPCLYNPQSFLKMAELSRDVVMYIGITSGSHVGVPCLQAREKTLVERITGHAAGHNGSNLVNFPFNLLLSMGHAPIIDYVAGDWRQSESPASATERLFSQYGYLGSDGAETRRIIADYVEAHTKNGEFSERICGSLGIVTCRVGGAVKSAKYA